MQGGHEGGIRCGVRYCNPDTVKRIAILHNEWLCDGEIAERLRIEPLMVWHVRQFYRINRHADRKPLAA